MVKAIEKEKIEKAKAVLDAGGNRKQAAAATGISLTTVYKYFGAEDERTKEEKQREQTAALEKAKAVLDAGGTYEEAAKAAGRSVSWTRKRIPAQHKYEKWCSQYLADWARENDGRLKDFQNMLGMTKSQVAGRLRGEVPFKKTDLRIIADKTGLDFDRLVETCRK